MADGHVCVGVIVGVHGVKGAVRVRSYTERPEDFAAYGPLEDERGRRFEARATGRIKGAVIATIEGVEDRDAALALKGTRLYVPRKALPEPEADEFYIDDLVGLQAELGDGTKLGRVVAVYNFGAGDVIEIGRDGLPPLDLPFTREVVPLVDIEGGRLVIAPPEGLFETPEGETEAVEARGRKQARVGRPAAAGPRRRRERRSRGD
jgi:16S rRNA processing protein RimM